MRTMFWSLVQNWGGRALNLLQFIILARFLGPKDFGLAAAAALVTLLIQAIAEFGFADAIIQRPTLKREDVNLPFYLSLAASLLLSLTAFALSSKIELWLGVPGLGKVVSVLSFTAPITTASLFQEAMYKRELAFKQLALRIMIANLLATFVSVPCAMMGLGVWSLVIQSYLVAIIGAVWIWSRPKWLPSTAMATPALKALSRYGVSILAMRLLDFAATRTVEILMINRYGVRGYGFYTASARLNQTMMDLLQAALNDVSLSLLSRLSGDLERLQEIYRKSLIIAGNTVPPVFILASAVMPEVSRVLFDQKWHGIDRIAGVLFVLGAVQSMQYFSRPYLGARGRSEMLLIISITKVALVLAALRFAPANDIYQLTYWYVGAQLMSAPISFAVTARELRVSYLLIYRELFPVLLASALAYLGVTFARGAMTGLMTYPPLMSGIILGLIFVAIYACVVLIVGRRQLMTVLDFGFARFKERRT